MRTNLPETDRVAAKAVPKLRNLNTLPDSGVNSTLGRQSRRSKNRRSDVP